MMSTDPLDDLLEQLCNGDAVAAERVFRAHEPHLRLVIRRMLPPRLHSKFDSADVVQSAWADLLHGFRESGWRFQDAAHLRAFLVKVTKNRFLNKVRRYKKGVDQEQALEDVEAPAAADPRPSQVAQAEELWAQLLALCTAAAQARRFYLGRNRQPHGYAPQQRPAYPLRPCPATRGQGNNTGFGTAGPLGDRFVNV
jgi:DNA-directed RNA polymerase specialized sigma24 family protein